MNMHSSLLRTLSIALAVVAVPSLARAEALAQAVGLFNIFVGLMLVAAFLLLGGGLIMWLIRLGTFPTYRDEAIRYMEWSVAVLFVLIILLVSVQFVQSHTTQALFVLGIIIVGVFVFFAVKVLSAPEEKKEERPRP